MKEMAERNRVDGWVKNNPDGSVEALLQGEEGDVKEVLAWAHHGPAGATVESVNVKSGSIQILNGFKIVR
jgi:acylphosphatase